MSKIRRRTLVIRVGDHWFLRYIRDLYETLISKYTSNGEHKGIMSIFPKRQSSPFWFRKKTTYSSPSDENMTESEKCNREFFVKSKDELAIYLKNKASALAFSQPMDEATDLKIYIAGHCSKNSDKLYSLETSQRRWFTINVVAIAQHLDSVFKTIKVKSSGARPIKISLIACEAAAGLPNKADCFAVKLLTELHRLGHQHILVKARDESVSAPFFGKKFTSGKKEHFYLNEDTIFQVEKDNDVRMLALKTLKKCKERTYVQKKKERLEKCIQEIGCLGYKSQNKEIMNIIQVTKNSDEVKQYRDGTAWFMRFFNKPSNTEACLTSFLNNSETVDVNVNEVVTFNGVIA